MQPKILTVDNYFKYFNFNEQNTTCGIEREPESGENFFSAQIYLPKDFFNLDQSSFRFNPLMRFQLESLPDKILVKLELFAIGSIGKEEAFIFKPWIIGIDNPMIYGPLESFHLFFPSTLFYNFMERLIFLEQLNLDSFEHIRILQDIPTNTFQRFGLDKFNVEKQFNSKNLSISRIDNPNKTEILEFYNKNWEGLTDVLEHKYFRPLLNTWFRVNLKGQDKTIGFIRLYNNNSSFTGGTSIEYILDKSYRNKGFATESSLSVISLLKEKSYATYLGAEVNDKNEFSIKVLKNLGFAESKSSGMSSENFSLSLLEPLNILEREVENNNIEFGVQNQYARRYERYF